MRFSKLLLLAVAASLAHGPAWANPAGGAVVSGNAVFNNNGNLLTIANTPGTIINWQNFTILPGETTRFLQQGSSSAVLNRIVGQDPSQILGTLQSNGRVFLINPNGVVFGAGAQVDVNGLVASTLNITNEDFLAGRRVFNAGSVAGSIRNDGAITTPTGGHVYRPPRAAGRFGQPRPARRRERAWRPRREPRSDHRAERRRGHLRRAHQPARSRERR
jgi:filamentous hemagglutinin family protein